jgi:hypothetical protein
MRGSAGVQERVGRGEESVMKMSHSRYARGIDLAISVLLRGRLQSPGSRQQCNCLLCHTKPVV